MGTKFNKKTLVSLSRLAVTHKIFVQSLRFVAQKFYFCSTINTGVAQLVEHWSPKPGVGSSSLSSRALVEILLLESWPSGRRRTPGKCVNLTRVSRVRIPHSPQIGLVVRRLQRQGTKKGTISGF